MSNLNFEGKRESEILITIDGKSGAGKSILAEHLANYLSINHHSAGDFFRKISEEKGLTVEQLAEKAGKEIDVEVDRRTFRKGLSEDCVIESRIASRVLSEYADLKICLKADMSERAERVADRENLSLKEAKEQVQQRDRNDSNRYQKYYGIDIENLGIYDLVLDNTGLTVEETNKLVESAVDTWFKECMKY